MVTTVAVAAPERGLSPAANHPIDSSGVFGFEFSLDRHRLDREPEGPP